jgi:CRP-like cAMP-binding protein
LRSEFARGSALQRNLLRFSQSLMAQMAQTIVCNRHHSVQQQLIRWILLSVDRLEGSELQMTHHSIAHMLGVRRAGVSVAAQRLADQGLIEYSRGLIYVVDRAGLEDHACECYGVAKAEYMCLLADLEAPRRSG